MLRLFKIGLRVLLVKSSSALLMPLGKIRQHELDG